MYDNISNSNKQIIAHITGQLIPQEANTDASKSPVSENLELDLPTELVSATTDSLEPQEQDFSPLALQLKEAQEFAAQQFAELEEKIENKTLTLDDLLKNSQRALPFTFKCKSLPITLELFCTTPTVSQNFKIISGFNVFLSGNSKLINRRIELLQSDGKEENVVASLAELTYEMTQYVEHNYHLLKPALSLLCKPTGEKLTDEELELLLSRLNPVDYFELADAIIATTIRGKLTK